MQFKMKRHIQTFRIETNAGRIVGHAWHIEQAEHIAHKGRGRWVFKWVDGEYIAWRQYNNGMTYSQKTIKQLRG